MILIWTSKIQNTLKIQKLLQYHKSAVSPCDLCDGHTQSRWQVLLKILNITFSLHKVDMKQRNVMFNLGLQPQMSHYACVNIPKCKAVWSPFGPVHLWWGMVTKEYVVPCQHLSRICLLSLISFYGCFIEHHMTNLEKLIMTLALEARKVIYVLGGRESCKLLEVSWYPSLSWAFSLSPSCVFWQLYRSRRIAE